MPSASAPPGGGNTWSALAPLLEARQEVGVGELLGRIYVAGGYRADGSSATTVEVYDPATDRWTMAAPLPQGLNHPAAAVVGERFYVLGGDDGRGAVATNYEYDPRSNSWAAARADAHRAQRAHGRGDRGTDLRGRRLARPRGADARSLRPGDGRLDVAASHAHGPQPRGGRRHRGPAVRGGRPSAPDAVRPRGLRSRDERVVDASPDADGPLRPRGGGRARLPLRLRRRGERRARPRRVPAERALRPRDNAWTSLAAMRTPRHGIGAAVVGNRIFVPGGATVQGFGAVATHDAFEAPASRTCS